MPAGTPISLNNQQILRALSPFNILLNDEQMNQLREYISLLLRWNERISLTAIDDPIEIVGRHFGESIYSTQLLPVENCRLVDIGTGAGFPGLALKIASPDMKLTLIESNKKKCAFLAEVVRVLELTGVEILPERFEQIRPEGVFADVVTSRAVGEFKPLLSWSAKALKRRGHLMVWVGAEDSTRIAISQGWTWRPATHLPDSQRRFILIGRPLGPL